MQPITLPIHELKPALAGLGKIIGKRATLPVLGNIKIERIRDGWIALTSTDIDHHVTVRLEQPGTGEPAALLIPHDELQKTCKACGSGEEILVERTGKNAAAIRYRIGHQTVETKVESLPVEEFPEIPRIEGDAIPMPDALRQSIHEALQCVSTDETRLIINGAYLDVSDPKRQHVVGTDGCHLFSSNSFTLPLAKSLLIPSHKFLGWKEINADGEWQLKVGVPKDKDDTAPFQISSRRWRFISRQIGGNYPDWRHVVPAPGNYATSIEFDADVEPVLQTIGRMPCDDTVNFAIGLEVREGRFALLGRSPGAKDWTRIGNAGRERPGQRREDLPQPAPAHQGAGVRSDQGRGDRCHVVAAFQQWRKANDHRADPGRRRPCTRQARSKSRSCPAGSTTQPSANTGGTTQGGTTHASQTKRQHQRHRSPALHHHEPG